MTSPLTSAVLNLVTSRDDSSVTIVSDNEILNPKFLSCCGPEMSDYTLISNQSLLAIFNDMSDFIKKVS